MSWDILYRLEGVGGLRSAETRQEAIINALSLMERGAEIQSVKGTGPNDVVTLGQLELFAETRRAGRPLSF
jgi:hypothetical protein